MLKWVGGMTAVMTLIAGVYQFGRFVYESGRNRQRVVELVQLADNPGDRHQFSEAWQSLEAAAELGQEAERVRRAQEDLAML